LVLLYATCTVNKDYLGPYEPAVSYTPALDDFARSSLVFENHQTESGQSGIAFASIFSGTQATEHGVFVNPSRLPDDVLVIPEA
jgi:arylsulfatase A-like enzyme